MAHKRGRRRGRNYIVEKRLSLRDLCTLMAWAREVGLPLLCVHRPYYRLNYGGAEIGLPVYRGPRYYQRRRVFPPKNPNRRLIMRASDEMLVKIRLMEIECAR